MFLTVPSTSTLPLCCVDLEQVDEREMMWQKVVQQEESQPEKQVT